MKALTPDSLTQTVRSLRLRRSAVPTFRPQPRDPPDGRFEYQSPQRHQLFQASPLMSRLATRSRRNRFVILRTAGSPPVAPHPASRQRSYLRFRSLRPAPARTCPVKTKRPHKAPSSRPPGPRSARPEDRLQPGPIPAMDTGFRRYDKRVLRYQQLLIRHTSVVPLKSLYICWPSCVSANFSRAAAILRSISAPFACHT
jgi:hypothetical protein